MPHATVTHLNPWLRQAAELPTDAVVVSDAAEPGGVVEAYEPDPGADLAADLLTLTRVLLGAGVAAAPAVVEQEIAPPVPAPPVPVAMEPVAMEPVPAAPAAGPQLGTLLRDLAALDL